MPTPSHQEPVVPGPSSTDQIIHTSCPPASDSDIDMVEGHTNTEAPLIPIHVIDLSNTPNSPDEVSEPLREPATPINNLEDIINTESDLPISATSAPIVSLEPKCATFSQTTSTDGAHDPFPMTRFRPNTSSSFLKPGAKFSGIQRSEKQEYEVTVDIQHVDMASSYLCGYLRIRGLSDAHPTLTTFFEGEMIGTKYTFITQHPEWGASEKVDWTHWSRFQGFRPLSKDARRPNFMMKNWMHKENIWMRWKEYFVVPDHTITDLPGASFDGFYYICFNQITGGITGAYYHHKSEQYVPS